MRASKCVAVLVTLVSSLATAAIVTADEVTITRLTGSVEVLVNGSRVSARAGAVISTPLRIKTGSDGSLHIEQASSDLDIGPDTVVVLPGASTTERIIQEIGRVLYSVKPRKVRSFAVETPYLVSVVKGTTFSVAIENAATTVALLEGSIEVSGPGTNERVLLMPNQSAHRAAGERTIAVTKIDSAAPAVRPRAHTDGASSPLAGSSNDARQPQPLSVASDLSEITAAYADRRVHAIGNTPPPVATPQPGPTPVPTPDPTAPSGPPPAAPPGPAPQPDPTPSPTPDPTSSVPLPPTPPVPDPPPPILSDPTTPPGPSDDNDGQHDHNNGHGNDEDGRDESNPGRGHGHRNRR